MTHIDPFAPADSPLHPSQQGIRSVEDEAANLSLPTQAVQSAPPSDAVAGQRNDAGPEEGTAAQAMQPPYTASPDYRSSYQPATPEAGSTVKVDPSTGFRYDGGPNEGSSADAMADTQPPKPGVEPRYDGGPDEGSSAGAIAQP